MPSPANPRRPARQQARFDPNRGSAPAEMIELVDPRWILKALGLMLTIGLVCAYLTLCVVFWHTQWQLVLHPSRDVAVTPANFDLPFKEVHFGADASGQPQLDGWWIPGNTATDPAVLVLHGGDGNMADALPAAHLLHEEGFQVLLFDYRGFGHSAGAHPTEALMQADAASALEYIVSDGRAAAGNVLVYGIGLGGAVAAQLCQEHSSITALILDGPDGDVGARAAAEVRSHIVPTSLLFHERFPLAAPLASLHTPKLLISYTTGPAPAALARAADPKITVELPAGASVRPTLSRFLGAIFPRGPTEIIPTP